jgi:hypothetical protein
MKTIEATTSAAIFNAENTAERFGLLIPLDRKIAGIKFSTILYPLTVKLKNYFPIRFIRSTLRESELNAPI